MHHNATPIAASPYLEKLDRAAFERALSHGRGAAMLHVQAFGLDGIADLVLTACLHDTAYDSQCEAERSAWLYAMFKTSPHYSQFAAAIVAALAEASDQHSLEQICNLAGLMALDGDSNAANALRDFVWGQDFSNEGNQYGGQALAALDGLCAIEELARRFGRLLQQLPNAWVDDLDHLTEKSGNYDAALSTLTAKSEQDDAIAAYVLRHTQELAERLAQQAKPDEVRKREASQRVRQQSPLATMLSAAEAGKGERPSFYLVFGRWATDEELGIVYQHLLATNSAETRLRLLWVFRKAPLPSLPPQIWAWVTDSDSRLREAALYAMAQLSDARIAVWGRQQLRDPTFSEADADVLELFAKNYQAGDEVLIMSALQKLELDDDGLHDIGLAALRVCDGNTNPALAGLAEWVYRTNPCSLCRHSALAWLQQAASLPLDIAEDGRHCAAPDTQALAQTTSG